MIPASKTVGDVIWEIFEGIGCVSTGEEKP